MPLGWELTTSGLRFSGTADKVFPLGVGALGNELGAEGNADIFENCLVGPTDKVLEKIDIFLPREGLFGSINVFDDTNETLSPKSNGEGGGASMLFAKEAA